jgi:hypothetical protein
MRTRYRYLALAVGLAVTAAAATGLGAAPSGPDAAKASTPPVYRPVTSDLMNAVIQPRHIKLWLAGKNGDWEYAEYERHNIGGALARIAAAIPIYKGQPMESLNAAFATPALAELDTAIKQKDAAAFEKAYGDLTTGCNQCHQATNHPMVVIKVPDGNPFPDQDFEAPHG